MTAGDYLNNGYEDLLVTGYGRVILYRNNGNGTFTDVTKQAGIDVKGWSISSTWLDYNHSGCLSLFVGRYVDFDPKYRNYYAADTHHRGTEMKLLGTGRRLFLVLACAALAALWPPGRVSGAEEPSLDAMESERRRMSVPSISRFRGTPWTIPSGTLPLVRDC